MISLKKRLEVRKDEILKVTAEEGRGAGMRFAGVKCGIAFTKWLALPEVAGDKNFGICPTKPDTLRSDYWFMHQAFMEAHKERLSLLKTRMDIEQQIEKVEQDIRMWEWKILEAKRTGIKLCEVIDES